MRPQARRIAVAILALAATFAVLFFAQRLLFATQTQAPLKQRLLTVPQVESVSLELSASPQVVLVTLGRVADLHETAQTLTEKIKAFAPEATLRVRGHADATLSSAEEDLSFPVQQGLASGQFVEMRQEVLQEAMKLQVTARIYIDANDVDLALYDRGHAAYYIYPRGGKS